MMKWRTSDVANVAATLLLAVVVQRAARADANSCPELERRFESIRAGLAAPQINSLLFSSADDGCDALAGRLIEAGASVDARDRGGSMPLTHAAGAGHASVVKLLLDRGANVNQRNIKGSTPLYAAIENNREHATQELLDRGADVNISGQSNVSPLSAAAFNGSDTLLELLLKHGADPKTIDATGKSPIVYAAARGFIPIVDRLLAAGVGINAKYGNDLTVLMWAAGHTNDVPDDVAVRLVTMLLDRGAHIDDVDNRGRSALMTAAELGHAAIANLLVFRGAKLDLRDNDSKSAADLTSMDTLRTQLTAH